MKQKQKGEESEQINNRKNLNPTYDKICSERLCLSAVIDPHCPQMQSELTNPSSSPDPQAVHLTVYPIALVCFVSLQLLNKCLCPDNSSVQGI